MATIAAAIDIGLLSVGDKSSQRSSAHCPSLHTRLCSPRHAAATRRHPSNPHRNQYPSRSINNTVVAGGTWQSERDRPCSLIGLPASATSRTRPTNHSRYLSRGHLNTIMQLGTWQFVVSTNLRCDPLRRQSALSALQALTTVFVLSPSRRHHRNEELANVFETYTALTVTRPLWTCPSAQLGHEPPQSMSTSSPFCTASSQRQLEQRPSVQTRSTVGQNACGFTHAGTSWTTAVR